MYDCTTDGLINPFYMTKSEEMISPFTMENRIDMIQPIIYSDKINDKKFHLQIYFHFYILY